MKSKKRPTTPVFIFADTVAKILKSGKKELELPQGARISAAAGDMIRDNKIRIIYVASGQSTTDAQVTEARQKPTGAQEGPQVQELSESGKSKSEPALDPAGEIRGDVLEDIVDRVIERFKQLKGLKPATPAATADTGVDPQAEAAGEDDLVICRCEEITREEIKEAIRNGMHTLNGVKRVTRAGMGLCQGQTCQRLVAQILTEELNLAAADIDPTTARGPVRPLRLEVFANS